MINEEDLENEELKTDLDFEQFKLLLDALNFINMDKLTSSDN
jgi:hypothetical protein